MPAADRLLRTLDRLPYPARQRAVAAEGRRLAGTAELRPVLEDLTNRDGWERGLAVALARIAGDRDFVAQRLADRHHEVSTALLHAAVDLELATAAFTDRLPTLPRRARFALYRLVRRVGRAELADALVDAVLARFGEHEAARLLSRCSPGVAARLLPQLAFAVPSWAAMGRHHPDLVLGHLEAERDGMSRLEWSRLVQRLSAGVAAATEHDPPRVLTLVEGLEDGFDPFTFLRRHLRLLVRHDAQRVARLMLDPRRGTALPRGRKLVHDLAVLDDDLLARLARTVGPGDLVRVLHALPPTRRPAVYRGVVGTRDPFTDGYPVTLLDELPLGARHAETTRLLELRAVRDERHLRLMVTARGPWEMAEPVLREATRHPDADERGAAYELLFRAAAATRDPGVVELALASSDRLPNDQDPVRERAFRALAALPAHLYDEASTDRLRSLARAALEARDCSAATRQHIGTLGRRLVIDGSLSQRPVVLAAGLGLIGEISEQGWVSSGPFGATLPGGVEVALFEALRPRLAADAARGRFDGTLALAADLGRRGWTLPELQALIGRACQARNDAVVRRAISRWLDPPQTRDERVEAVFRRDRSTITIHEVASTIAKRRTDLLDDVLSGSLHGRFLARRVRHVPVLSHPERWLPRQVAAYRDLQLTLAGTDSAAGWERASAVRALGGLPGSDSAILRYLHDPSRGLVQDAMTALGHADDPEAALAVLLQRADGDDAHVAVAAAARCAGFVPPDRLEAALGPVITGGKVTARKEAARLLAVHHVPGAGRILGEMWEAPGQHRDVRRAIVSVLPLLLDDPASWDLLDRAVADHELASQVLEVDPTTLSPRYRAPYAARVRGVAAGDHPDNALDGLHRLADWARFDPVACLTLLADTTSDLSATATWRAALAALVRTSASLADATVLHRAGSRLLDAHTDVDPLHNAAPDRDLPARQRLAALAARFANGLTPATRPGAADLAAVIARSPDCVDIALRLHVAAVPWTEGSACLAHLHGTGAMIEATSLGAYAADLIRTSLAEQLRFLDADALGPLADAVLEGAGGPFVAFGIVIAAGQSAGWPEDLRARLRGLRAHPAPDLRRLAAATTTSPE